MGDEFAIVKRVGANLYGFGMGALVKSWRCQKSTGKFKGSASNLVDFMSE